MLHIRPCFSQEGKVGIHRDPELNSHGAVADGNVRGGDEIDEIDTTGASAWVHLGVTCNLRV